MLTPAQVVFLFDVDNTLLDNDRFAADLSARLEQEFGAAGHDRYWALYAKLRDELGYADYLATLQAFRAGRDDDPHLLQMSAFLLEYPFAQRLYPRALEALAHLGTLGLPVVLTDGEVVFQPRKVQRSGIWDAVAGRVLVTLHKQRRLDLVQRRFPASHYVMIEDKPQLLAAMKRVLADRLTTVFVRQGHYATESDHLAIDPAPDLSIERIGDLCELALVDFHSAAATSAMDADRQKAPGTTSQEQP
ncbi:MAG TPA: HAD family hydrolase [Kofleriaceae bacterium]|nr:HAD family hydrolase [Kofleriaceae bacterium]